MRKATAKRRAAKGAAFLDSVWPAWWRHVRINQLDLGSGCNCVLGQLGKMDEEDDESYSKFIAGPYCDRRPLEQYWLDRGPAGRLRARLVQSRDAAIRRGFDQPSSDPQVWAWLTEAWRDEIRTRAKAARS